MKSVAFVHAVRFSLLRGPFLRIAEVDWADVQPFHDHQYFLGRAGRNQQPATGAIRLEQSDSVEISLVYGPMLN